MTKFPVGVAHLCILNLCQIGKFVVVLMSYVYFVSNFVNLARAFYKLSNVESMVWTRGGGGRGESIDLTLTF